MSEDLERARYGAMPRELFLFTQGASTWALTGGDLPFDYLGVTYEKAVVGRTEAEFSSEAQAGNITITLPADHAVIAGFTGRPIHAPLFVLVRRVHPNGQAICDFIGQVLKVEFTDTAAHLACAPMIGALTRPIPSLVYQTACPRTLYGPGCNVDRELYRARVTVEGADGLTVVSTALAAFEDDWFADGWVEMENGDRRGISSSAGPVLVLNAPFARMVAGDAISVFPGCDRTPLTCGGKFGNLNNCLACPNIPATNPYDGRMA